MPSPTFLDLAASIDPVLNRNINFTRRQVASGATALTNFDFLVDVDAAGGAAIITLPDSTTVKRGMLFEIKKIDVSANTVTVNAFGGQTIDGAPAQVLSDQWRNLVVYSDGTNYKIFASSLTTPVGVDTGLALTSTGITYTGGVEGFGAIADVTGVTINFNLAIAATVQFFCSGTALCNPFIQGNYLGLAVNVNGTDHYVNGTGAQGFFVVGGGILNVDGFTSGDAIHGHLVLPLAAGAYAVKLRAFGNGFLESSATFPTKLTAVYPLVTGPVAGAAALISQESGPFADSINPPDANYIVVAGSSLSVILTTAQTILMSGYSTFIDPGSNSILGNLGIRVTSPGPVVVDYDGARAQGGNDLNAAESGLTRAVQLAAGTHTFELIVRSAGALFEFENAFLTLVYNDPIAIATTPKAATLVVHPTAGDGDYQTIEGALSNLPAEGGYILVREGTYTPPAGGYILPDKPVVIRGCGDSTIIDLAAVGDPAFVYGFAGRNYTLEDLNVTGTGANVNRRIASLTAAATLHMHRITATNMRQVAEVTGGVAAVLHFEDISVTLLNDAGSWFVNANATTFVRAVDCLVTGSGNMGGINGGPTVEMFGCTVSAVNGVSVNDDSVLSGSEFRGSAGETVTVGDRTKVTSCVFDALLLDVSGDSVEFSACQFLGAGTQDRCMDVTAAAAGPLITGCTFSGCDVNHIRTSSIDTIIHACQFFDNGSLVRSVDVLATAFRTIIDGNNFQFQTEAVQIACANVIVTNNVGCRVTETGAGNQNVYANNTGFDAAAIIGLASRIENNNVIETAVNLLLTDLHRTVLVDAAGANRTVTLPTAVSSRWRIYTVKKIDATANTVTIDADAGELIDGLTVQTITTQYQSFTIQSDGTEWWIL